MTAPATAEPPQPSETEEAAASGDASRTQPDGAEQPHDSADETEPPEKERNAGQDSEVTRPVPEAEKPRPAELIDRAINRMREAGRRISSEDPGDEAQQAQRAAVEDLDALIELLQQQPPPPSRRPQSSNQQQKPRQQQRQTGQRQSKPMPGGKESSAGMAGGQPGGATGKNQEDPAESSQRNADRREENGGLSGREAMSSSVWGHLPPKMREKLFNVYDDKFLPEYDDLVRRYFESLAEEGRSRNRNP